MAVLRHPVFLVFLIIFLLNQLLQRAGIHIYLVHSYADDICCMPVLLTLASALMSFVYYGKAATRFVYNLSAVQVCFALVYCIILFEFILPAYSAAYTKDLMDIPAYIAGALIFWLFINKNRIAIKR